MPRPCEDEDDDGVELCPVALGRTARERLNHLSQITGKPPLRLAADLLDELLEDDAREHAPVRGTMN